MVQMLVGKESANNRRGRVRRGAADVEKVDFVQCGGCCLKIPGKGNSLAG